MSWVRRPGGVSWSRVWGGNLGFLSFYFVLELIEQNAIQPWSSIWTFIKCSESTAFRVLQVQDEHCQSFTMASLSLMVSKNQTKTKEKDHLFPHQNLWIKGKVETGHKLSSGTKSTNWSQSGNGQWKLKTFCSSSEESPPSPLCPPPVYFRSSFSPYLLDTLTIHKTITKRFLFFKMRWEEVM